MNRRSLAALCAVLALLAAPGAWARECEVGMRPGSTLLFPYFEVDLANPNGLTTLISINSDSNAPTLARVVVWTDWAIPVAAFDLYLNPHDIQSINLRDLIEGNFPSSGAGASLNLFANCTTMAPSYPKLSRSEADQLRAQLTGDAVTGTCKGSAYGDHRARGYITVDASKRCGGLRLNQAYGTDDTPMDANYFTTLAIVDNVLWGDMFYVDASQNSAQGVEAVAIRAGAQTGPSTNTFYGRYHSWDGSDQRAPLPSLWSSRFLNGGAFDGGTDFIVFRDTRSAWQYTDCGQPPHWYPLLSASLAARDEAGTSVLSLGKNGSFPLATQKVAVSSLGQGGPAAAFGQVQFGLGFPDGTGAGAWVIPVMRAEGKFSVDFNGQPVNSTCGDTAY